MQKDMMKNIIETTSFVFNQAYLLVSDVCVQKKVKGLLTLIFIEYGIL